LTFWACEATVACFCPQHKGGQFFDPQQKKKHLHFAEYYVMNERQEGGAPKGMPDCVTAPHAIQFGGMLGNVLFRP
jgi:hypothetical protein